MDYSTLLTFGYLDFISNNISENLTVFSQIETQTAFDGKHFRKPRFDFMQTNELLMTFVKSIIFADLCISALRKCGSHRIRLPKHRKSDPKIASS